MKLFTFEYWNSVEWARMQVSIVASDAKQAEGFLREKTNVSDEPYTGGPNRKPKDSLELIDEKQIILPSFILPPREID
jgi:hypothetical protein